MHINRQSDILNELTLSNDNLLGRVGLVEAASRWFWFRTSLQSRRAWHEASEKYLQPLFHAHTCLTPYLYGGHASRGLHLWERPDRVGPGNLLDSAFHLLIGRIPEDGQICIKVHDSTIFINIFKAAFVNYS